MFCRKCGKKIEEDSVFCKHCGAKLQEPAAAAPAMPPPAASTVPAAPSKPPILNPSKTAGADEAEQTLWEGRFCGRSLGHWYVLWGVWFLFVAYGYLFRFETVERTTLLNILVLVLVFGPFLYLGFVHLKRQFTVKYRLSTHRLFRQEGIFSRTMSEVELFRVDDVSVRQGILQRIFNVGDVTVISTDSLEPRMELIGIDNPMEVKEQIRAGVQRRRSNRTMYMENI